MQRSFFILFITLHCCPLAVSSQENQEQKLLSRMQQPPR